MTERPRPMKAEGPQPFADVAAHVLEETFRQQLLAQPDDTARKKLVMDLRARGALSDELTAMAFYWFPNLRSA